MLLLIQCVALCAVFTVLILPSQFKDPLSQILSYPPAIRQRVEGLPQYKDRLKATKDKNLARKIIGTLLGVFVLAAMAYFSGKTTFVAAFLHVFILFFAVNLYDLVIFDFIVFSHSKKVIIPGTEDMVMDYRNPMHHIKGACKGIVIGSAASALAAGIVVLAGMLIQQ